MTVVIDKVGRLVVPKEIRDQLGIGPNSELEILIDGLEIRVRKIEEKSTLKKKGKFTVVSTDWVGETDPVKLIQKARKERDSQL
ncbi:MAG TPA: AbrB/MazE/SpoVT family DNA-binding domain-containing protein [Leptospiraceae bacterium]|nr:AbrB/MazE/SpoVT family DNA-binding domain-containing protein [Leptospiraceae bacterium]HMX33620.1 AbrB/MazE/SpoVT family DNA-binding domain-containing protein [Leptospiraceae bacterium]HMY33785.1 AbrB/MazE/SpoVT family DNA-binding domain-containing protein [Leptospiraceae bacterium]HMZ64841.1 AbrB/MazE/SpoVT family DNA-binding domain-containing protein [Leptospiraceae bacterium]HNA10146.1 AbrB/MazE/SpoVT family DNA-binding domain-containing protein [Leptospiraceae bacterium]